MAVKQYDISRDRSCFVISVRRRKAGERWFRTEALWSDQGSKLSVTTHYLDDPEPMLNFPPSTVCPVAEIGMPLPDPHSGKDCYLSCWECCGQRLQRPSPCHVPFGVAHVQWRGCIKAWPLSSTSDKSEGPFSLLTGSSEAVVGLYHSSASPSVHSCFLAFAPIDVDSKNVP